MPNPCPSLPELDSVFPLGHWPVQGIGNIVVHDRFTRL